MEGGILVRKKGVGSVDASHAHAYAYGLFGWWKRVTMMLAAAGSGKKHEKTFFLRVYFIYCDESHNVRAEIIKSTVSVGASRKSFSK
jgi:hypothetical protein